jgi:peptidoglycan/xylan/chitin deacetylase (PgdA/CDA1 family)
MQTYQWPNGIRLAVCLSFDVDAESPHIWQNPDPAKRSIAEVEQRRFGPRQGVPRILQLLKEFALKATFYVPGWTAEHYPGLVESIVADDHELGAHGYLHEQLDKITLAEETAILDKSLEVMQRLVGKRPVGYRSPSWQLSTDTPDLLVSRDFLYDSSLMGYDYPYSLQTASRLLTELPVQWLLDDAPQFRYVAIGGPPNTIADTEHVFRLWMDEFDGMYALGGGLLMLTMHPWITGRASRIMMLKRMIQYMRGHSGIWFATCADVASYHVASENYKAFVTKI